MCFSLCGSRCRNSSKPTAQGMRPVRHHHRGKLGRVLKEKCLLKDEFIFKLIKLNVLNNLQGRSTAILLHLLLLAAEGPLEVLALYSHQISF